MDTSNTEEDRREMLLPPSAGNGQDGEEDQNSGDKDVLSFSQELKELTVLSMPVALATLARLLIINTDVAFIGNLGTTELNASSFGSTWNQFLSNILFAPGYALNSLCSQAIGSGNPKLAGVWLQLAIFFTLILCLPVLAGYLLTKPVVSLMIDDDQVPELAQDFNNVSILILVPMVLYMIIRQFFQSMQIVRPAMVVSIITVGFNYAMNALFVPLDGPVAWGLKGSPFATFLSMLFQIISFCVYCIWYKGYHQAYWGGWDLKSSLEKSRVKRFFAMVIPMAVGIVLENSGLQLITFSTGHIGKANISANAVLGSLWGILWGFYWGFGLALQVRVGKYLGQNKPEAAKMVAKISVVIVIIICFLVGLGTFLLRTQIAKLFSQDQDVIKVIEDSMYALVLDYFFACMALSAVNLMEAMAQNRILMYVLSIGMWCVQVPVSLLFAYKVDFFKDREVEGLWLGQCVGELFKLVILWSYIARIDWHRMCKEALERSERAETVVEEQDSALEHMLEEQDIHFAEEAQAMPIARSPDARSLASTMMSTSPFVGSRSPKFTGRHID